MRPHDPGGLALRAGLRVAIVSPLVFAVGLQIDQQTALFAIFGSLALMVFADFSGPIAVRAVAYGALAGTGCLLIALGTLCSRSPVLACAAMAVVGLAILFAGVVNGYLATATSAALLSFILPLMLPAGAGEIPERLAGWLLAYAVAVPVLLLVLPQRRPDQLREAIAAAARAVAELVADPGDARAAAADGALDGLRSAFAATPYRPTGPTGATGALGELVDELEWLRELAGELSAAHAAPLTPTELELRAESAALLQATATIVADPAAPPSAVDRIEALRGQVAGDAIDALAGLDRAGAADADLWDRVRGAWEVRVISYGALDVARRAGLAAGHGDGGDGPRWARFAARQRVALAASGRLAAAHADVRSVWLRNSLRGAVGLAAAVLVAQEASVQHGFWVVLGVLSVLRSSAVGTARTIVDAFAGTLAGITIAALLLLAVGDAEAVLWAVLPFACFAAAYAPRAVGFAAGQAGFSVAVLVVFNLIAPTGWEVGLVRIEDVSIGFAISLGVGLLLWPRGAHALLRRSLGAAFAAGGRFTALAAAQMLGATRDELAEAAALAAAADGRLDAAVRQRLSERGGHDTEQFAVGMRLVGGAARLRRTGTVLLHLHDITPHVRRPAGLEPLVDGAERLGDWYGALGEALAAGSSPPPPDEPDGELRQALVSGVRDGVRRGDRERAQAAIAAAWTGMHVGLMRRMQRRVAAAAGRLAGD